MNELVDDLISTGYLKTPRIIEAFRSVDRAHFMLPEYRSLAYVNTPASIDYQQTISQPATVAFMLEELHPQPGHTILDIGAGSGWQSTLLAHIVGSEGHVYSIERIPEISVFGKENVHSCPAIDPSIVTWTTGNAKMGLEEHAPFDRIIAAASTEEIPLTWLTQLSDGGVLVAPIKESIVSCSKTKSDTVCIEHEGYLFVPLIT